MKAIGGATVLLSTILFLGAPAEAQDLVFDESLVSACLAAADVDPAGRSCVGQAAEACTEMTPGGLSNAGIGRCTNAELQVWDDALNAIYKEIRASAEQNDKDLDELGSAAPRQVPALRDMQRAWIAYRDQRCAYEASLWGGGSGAGPAAISCALALTAEQALYLATKRVQ